MYGVNSVVGLDLWHKASHPCPLPGGEGERTANGGPTMHVIEDLTKTTQVLVQVALTLLS